MEQVFISYKSQDHEFAFELNQQVKDAGIDTWIDKEWLRAGEDWREEIDEAIKNSFAMILIMTPAAAQSKYVIYEFAFAWALGIKVVPVMLDYVELKDFHPRLEGRQYEDFQRKHSWGKLIKRLQEIENQYSSPTVPVPRDAPLAIRQAVKNLEGSQAERESAIRDLGNSNHPAALEALYGAVKHHMSDVRVAASLALAKRTQYADKGAIDGLIEGLSEQGFVSDSEEALLRFGQLAVPNLIEVLDTENPKVRERVAELLGGIRDERAVKPLTLTLRNDPDLFVRVRTARVLGQLAVKDAAVLSVLREALRYDQREVGHWAAWSLGVLKDEDAIWDLIESMRDPHVLQQAFQALRDFGQIAVPQLLTALDDPLPDIRAAVIELLASAGDASAVPTLMHLLQDEHEKVRSAAKGAIFRLATIAHLETLLKNSLSSNTEIRELCVDILGRLGHGADDVHRRIISQRLIELLDDQEEGVQRIAAQGLGKMRSPEAVPKLAEILRDSRRDDEVHAVAIQSLKLIGTSNAHEALLSAERWRQKRGGQQA